MDAAWDEQVLPALCDYTRIPCLSPAFDPEWSEHGHMESAATLLRQWVDGQGGELRTEIVRLPGRTPVLVVENAGEGDPIVIYGHMDKQPPLGEWRNGLGPYEPVRQGDKLFGRGTADDGYATFAAVTGLVAAGGGHGRVLVLIEASEESGSPDLPAYLDHLRDRIGTPRLVICLDSGGLSYDRLWLTTSLRGNLVVTVRVDVLTEGIHSGQGGGVVPSSFRILRKILSRIEDETNGRILLPGLQGAGIPEEHLANLRAIAAEFPDDSAPVVDGLRLLETDPVELLAARTWGAALEVTGADGLPTPRQGGNVLRPSTTLKFSLRLPPDVDAAAAGDALLSAITTDEGAHITIDMEAAAQGWVAPSARRRRGGRGGPGVEGTIRPRAGPGGRGRIHPVPGRPAAGLPRHPDRRHGRPRAALERSRTERVAPRPHGEGRDPPGGRARAGGPLMPGTGDAAGGGPGAASGGGVLSGKVALVTGGSRGLGRDMALAFAGAGADVVVASRKLQNCEEVAAEVEAMGRRALAVACHVGHWEELDGLVEQAYDAFGHVDVLVNNAGMSPLYEDLPSVTEELWDKVVGVNLKGPFRLTALVGTRMAAGSHGGSIINVSSTGSLRPMPHMLPYDAAKAGLNTLTEGFAKAFGPTVRVNCIMAGPFLTDISKAWDQSTLDTGMRHHALQRAGQPEEIVGAALYFASDASSFTTGAILRVDGGIP